MSILMLIYISIGQDTAKYTQTQTQTQTSIFTLLKLHSKSGD